MGAGTAHRVLGRQDGVTITGNIDPGGSAGSGDHRIADDAAAASKAIYANLGAIGHKIVADGPIADDPFGAISDSIAGSQTPNDNNAGADVRPGGAYRSAALDQVAAARALQADAAENTVFCTHVNGPVVGTIISSADTLTPAFKGAVADLDIAVTVGSCFIEKTDGVTIIAPGADEAETIEVDGDVVAKHVNAASAPESGGIGKVAGEIILTRIVDGKGNSVNYGAFRRAHTRTCTGGPVKPLIRPNRSCAEQHCHRDYQVPQFPWHGLLLSEVWVNRDFCTALAPRLKLVWHHRRGKISRKS